MDLERLIAVARGDEPADLVLTGGRVVDVLSGEIRRTSIAVAGGMIAGLGDGYRGRDTLDLRGRYVCPGFIDAHVHVESSLVRPLEFARAVVPHGVTTVVSNPHEIANVVGIGGIRYMMRDARKAPLDQLFTIPSCVPATSLSTSGARLTKEDIAFLLREPGLAGLGEVMDFPAVVAGAGRVLEEISLCGGLPRDGHCPGLGGMELNAYAAAGITSEHECTTDGEAREKLARGMKIFIREGSVARNLKNLLPVVTPHNERWLCFCTDDRKLTDLLDEGSIDHLVRMAIAGGIPPVTAIRMATLNPSEHFRLSDRGVIAPGRRADLVVFSDLDEPRAELVYCRGALAARDGDPVSGMFETAGEGVEPEISETIHIDWSGADFRIPVPGGAIRVIGIVPDQLLTESLHMEPRLENGCAVSDPARDLLKMAVIERHRASGRTGLGFVRGVGLRRGALASTVAHDHHNLIVIGADDLSMETAARAAAAAGGGQAVADGETVLAILPLPVAGLMSDRPTGEVRERMSSLFSAAGQLGSTLDDPFMTMSFLGLEVIPSLKLTDLGLIDVNLQKVVPLLQTS
ncbi:MAG TPA: adenine deaminase [Geobacteraceae bacterium]|nr:adenine deaminase [Geobacteraceae bacterium]